MPGVPPALRQLWQPEVLNYSQVLPGGQSCPWLRVTATGHGSFTHRLIKKKNCLLIQFHKDQTITDGAPWGEFREERRKTFCALNILAFRELTCKSKEKNSNDPRLLHPRIGRRALKSFTWDMFFVISSNLLMCDSMFFSEKTVLCILAPPLPLQSSSSDLSERLSPGLTQLLCYVFFFQSIGSWRLWSGNPGQESAVFHGLRPTFCSWGPAWVRNLSFGILALLFDHSRT